MELNQHPALFVQGKEPVQLPIHVSAKLMPMELNVIYSNAIIPFLMIVWFAMDMVFVTKQNFVLVQMNIHINIVKQQFVLVLLQMKPLFVMVMELVHHPMYANVRPDILNHLVM